MRAFEFPRRTVEMNIPIPMLALASLGIFAIMLILGVILVWANAWKVPPGIINVCAAFSIIVCLAIAVYFLDLVKSDVAQIVGQWWLSRIYYFMILAAGCAGVWQCWIASRRFRGDGNWPADAVCRIGAIVAVGILLVVTWLAWF